jgi:uncharacterized protein
MSAILSSLSMLVLTSFDVWADPSFDCSEVTRPDEQAICSDNDLARRDQLDDQAFKALRRRPELANALLEAGRKFIAARRACGSQVDCIRQTQIAVLSDLNRMARSTSNSAGEPLNISPPVAAQDRTSSESKPPAINPTECSTIISDWDKWTCEHTTAASEPAHSVRASERPLSEQGTPNSRDATAFSLRGVRLGIKMSEFLKLNHPDGADTHSDCSGPDSGKSDPSTICDLKSNKRDDPIGGWQNIAGQKMDISYYFMFDLPKGSEQILHKMIGRSAYGYETVFLALREKYGSPDMEKSIPVQNLYGAQFSLPSAVWKSGGSTISIRTVSISGEFYLTYSLDRFTLRLQEEEEKRLGRPADHL